MLVHDVTARCAGKSGQGQNNGWYANYVTTDWDDFVKRYWNSEGIVAIMDEASNVSMDSEHVKQQRQIMQRGRHHNNLNILISQHVKSLDKAAREQCAHAMIFKVFPDVAKELATMYGDEVKNAHKLLPLEYYYHKGGHVPTTKHTIPLPKS